MPTNILKIQFRGHSATVGSKIPSLVGAIPNSSYFDKGGLCHSSAFLENEK